MLGCVLFVELTLEAFNFTNETVAHIVFFNKFVNELLEALLFFLDRTGSKFEIIEVDVSFIAMIR